MGRKSKYSVAAHISHDQKFKIKCFFFGGYVRLVSVSQRKFKHNID